MAGNNSVRGDETITFTDNMSFDGTERGGKMTTNGQLWIGSTSARHVKLGSITSPLGTLAIGYSSPNITMDIVGGAVAIETIAGDTGSISGNSVTIFANNATNNSGQSVSFVNSGTVSTFNVTDANHNTMIGKSAGNPGQTYLRATALGNLAANSLTSGNGVYIGYAAGQYTTTGGNVFIGENAGRHVTTGAGNICVGINAFGGVGPYTGNFNVIIGNSAGSNYSGIENNNIIISSSGIVADANTIRIGSQSDTTGQNKCFIAGIVGVTPSNLQLMAINSSTGQLGVQTGVGTIFSDGTTAKTIIPLWYGDGSDGSVTFDGSTTILGLIPSGNVYTLIRDLNLASSTINNGVTINTAGYRIYCAGTLTNNGAISFIANNGLTGGNGGASTTGSLAASSTAGGNGNTGNGGVSGTTSTSLGGVGGNGGAGGTGTAGTAGPVVVPAGSSGSYHAFFTYTSGVTQNLSALHGGGGGGGGGGDSVNKGGGGGAGGGVILIVAYIIAGTGTISANGGNGGNGAVAATGAGGGGAGGGGLIIITSTSASGNAVSGQTLSVAPGTPGTHTGTGADGSAGASGTIIVIAA